MKEIFRAGNLQPMQITNIKFKCYLSLFESRRVDLWAVEYVNARIFATFIVWILPFRHRDKIDLCLNYLLQGWQRIDINNLEKT